MLMMLLLLLLRARGSGRREMLGGRRSRGSARNCTGVKPAFAVVFVADELFENTLGALLVDLLVGGELRFLPTQIS